MASIHLHLGILLPLTTPHMAHHLTPIHMVYHHTTLHMVFHPMLSHQFKLILGVDLALGDVDVAAREVVVVVEEAADVATMEERSVTVIQRPIPVRFLQVRCLLDHPFFMQSGKALLHSLDHLV